MFNIHLIYRRVILKYLKRWEIMNTFFTFSVKLSSQSDSSFIIEFDFYVNMIHKLLVIRSQSFHLFYITNASPLNWFMALHLRILLIFCIAIRIIPAIHIFRNAARSWTQPFNMHSSIFHSYTKGRKGAAFGNYVLLWLSICQQQIDTVLTCLFLMDGKSILFWNLLSEKSLQTIIQL